MLRVVIATWWCTVYLVGLRGVNGEVLLRSYDFMDYKCCTHDNLQTQCRDCLQVCAKNVNMPTSKRSATIVCEYAQWNVNIKISNRRRWVRINKYPIIMTVITTSLGIPEPFATRLRARILGFGRILVISIWAWKPKMSQRWLNNSGRHLLAMRKCFVLGVLRCVFAK